MNDADESPPPGGDDPPTAEANVDGDQPADAAGEADEAVEERQDTRTLMLNSIGGWRGMVDSGLPIVVFVLANGIGGLTAGIWAAISVGALLFLLRLARRQSVQQALGGFIGVAVAAFIASRTGEAKGYFLFGIWASFFYATAFLVSVLVRWPAVGVIWEYVESGTTAWRAQRPLVRVYTWTTLVWASVFLARGLVQRFLYNEDETGWLAFARIAMGYPLTLSALGITLLAVRRAHSRHRRPAEPATG